MVNNNNFYCNYAIRQMLKKTLSVKTLRLSKFLLITVFTYE